MLGRGTRTRLGSGSLGSNLVRGLWFFRRPPVTPTRRAQGTWLGGVASVRSVGRLRRGAGRSAPGDGTPEHGPVDPGAGPSHRGGSPGVPDDLSADDADGRRSMTIRRRRKKSTHFLAPFSSASSASSADGSPSPSLAARGCQVHRPTSRRRVIGVYPCSSVVCSLRIDSSRRP